MYAIFPPHWVVVSGGLGCGMPVPGKRLSTGKKIVQLGGEKESQFGFKIAIFGIVQSGERLRESLPDSRQL